MMRRPWSRTLPIILLPSVLGAALIGPARGALAPGATGDAARLPPPERIRVLVEETDERLSVRGFDLRVHAAAPRRGRVDPELRELRRFARQAELEVSCAGGRVRARAAEWRGEGEALRLESPAGMLRYRERFLRDVLWVLPGEGSRCRAVNELELERYLDGLVSSEFSPQWSESAVEAQVIAARTYALHQVRRARMLGQSFDVYGSVKDQVYEGSHREDPRAARAVARTRGQVLVASRPGRDSTGPRPIKAFYHSTCGGSTELPDRVWGGRHEGFRRTVRCAWCVSSPRYDWLLELREEELRAELGRAAPSAAPRGWPADWRPRLVRHGLRAVVAESGRAPAAGGARRVETVRLVLGDGTGLRLEAPRFRDWIGASRLRSTAFAVERRTGAGTGAVYRFRGRGNGHGVGLCQWGAKVMGERGFDAGVILRHYYPDAIVTRLW